MTCDRPLRVGMLTGCAVPYKAPTYRALARSSGVEFTAIFASSAGVRPFDAGYARDVAWDSDILGGYRSIFLPRADQSPPLGRTFWTVRDLGIVRVLSRERFDVLWLDGYNSLTYMLAVLTQTALGGGLLFREEQTTLHPRRLGVTLAREVALRMLFRGHHAMYISRENRRWFEHYGVPASRLWSAPYTVDNAFFQNESDRLRPNREALRQEFGIAPDAGPVILTVGRMIPKKQPLYALEVFQRLRAKHRCAMLFVGSGPLEEDLRAAVARDRIPDVHFAGFLNQTEVSRAYACADVFTLLSLEHETFGVVVAEAMNFGLPVVATDKVGCSADLVLPGINGYVVPSGDPATAEASLSEIVSNPRLRHELSRGSLGLIEKWSPERTVSGVLEATRAVRGGGTRVDRSHRRSRGAQPPPPTQ